MSAADRCYQEFVEYIAKERPDIGELIYNESTMSAMASMNEFVVNCLWLDPTGGWIQYFDSLEPVYIAGLLSDRIYLLFKFIKLKYFKNWENQDFRIITDVSHDDIWDDIHYIVTFKGIVLTLAARDATSFCFKDRIEFYQFIRDKGQAWHEIVLRAYDTGFLVAVQPEKPSVEKPSDRWSHLNFDEPEEP